MKKIPTLFERVYENHKIVGITPKVASGMEWVLNGEGIATVKYDGSCCAIIGGELYKRYYAKHGKAPPEGAIPCCEPDPITGHHPHWVKCNIDNPSDKWFFEAYNYYINFMSEDTRCSAIFNLGLNTPKLECPTSGTYEAIGKHFNGNPYDMSCDLLIRHGINVIVLNDRSFNGIKNYLKNHYIEGIVFWKDGEPQCKIKRADFGFEWNTKRG